MNRRAFLLGSAAAIGAGAVASVIPTPAVQWGIDLAEGDDFGFVTTFNPDADGSWVIKSADQIFGDIQSIMAEFHKIPAMDDSMVLEPGTVGYRMFELGMFGPCKVSQPTVSLPANRSSGQSSRVISRISDRILIDGMTTWSD